MTTFLALLASVLWGTADFGGGLLSRRVPVAAVVLSSQAISLVVLCAGLAVPGVQLNLGGYLIYGALAGLAELVALFAFYRAMARGPMSLVAPMAACGTVIPVVYGIVRGEHPSLVQGCGIATAFVGVILVSGPEIRAGVGGRRTVLLSLIAAVGFGSLLLLSGLGAQGGVYGTLLAERIVGLGLMLPFLFVARSLRGSAWSRRTLGLAVLVGLGDVGASAAFLLAARGGHLAVVSVLGSLYPVASTLLARRLLAERLALVQNLGVLAALSGVVLINV